MQSNPKLQSTQFILPKLTTTQLQYEVSGKNYTLLFDPNSHVSVFGHVNIHSDDGTLIQGFMLDDRIVNAQIENQQLLYKGNILYFKPHGQGVITTTKFSWSGNFVQGKKHGVGVQNKGDSEEIAIYAEDELVYEKNFDSLSKQDWEYIEEQKRKFNENQQEIEQKIEGLNCQKQVSFDNYLKEYEDSLEILKAGLEQYESKLKQEIQALQNSHSEFHEQIQDFIATQRIQGIEIQQKPIILKCFKDGLFSNILNINLDGTMLTHEEILFIDKCLHEKKITNEIQNLLLDTNNLELPSVHFIMQMIQKHQLKNLEIFKFSFQKIDYQILLNTFTNTPICNLKLLDLNTTSLGSLNMALLCQAFKLCSQLIFLDLSNNFIGDDGLTQLSNILLEGNLQFLQTLLLENNSIGKNGVNSLALSLVKIDLAILTDLSLGGNNLELEGCQSIYKCFRIIQPNCLKTLNLKGCGLKTDEKQIIIQNFKHLNKGNIELDIN